MGHPTVYVFPQKCTSSTWTARLLAVSFSWNPMNVLLLRLPATNGCTSLDLVSYFSNVLLVWNSSFRPNVFFSYCQKCSIGQCGEKNCGF